MPSRITIRLAVLALLLAGLSFAAPPVVAQSLDQLRVSGAIGERYDGFAEARDPSVAGQVAQINNKRREIYQERAQAQGTTVDQVGRVYAQQILQQAPPGTWFLRPDGSWVQK